MIILRNKNFTELKFKSSGINGKPLSFKTKEPDKEEDKKKVIVSPNSIEEIEEHYDEDEDNYVYDPETGEIIYEDN